MTYRTSTYDVPIPLTNQDIMDVVGAIEAALCKLGVNPDIANGCVQIVVGPDLTESHPYVQTVRKT